MEQVTEPIIPVATAEPNKIESVPAVPYVPSLQWIELGLIAIFSVVFGLLHYYLFYGLSYGISAPIFTLTFLIWYFYLINRFWIKTAKVHYILGWIVFLFSLMLAIRAGIWLVVMNWIACIYTFFILLIVTFREKLDNLKLVDYTQRVGLFVPGIILGFGSFIRDLGYIKHNSEGKKFTPHIVKWILLALPAIGVFLILFSSADMVFNKYVSDLFTFNFSPDFPLRIINIWFFILLFLGLISFIIKKSRSSESNMVDYKPKWEMHSIEINIMLWSVVVLFCIFMTLQLTYLFSGTAMISVQWYTYSEYARKWFFELIVVACIVLAILWFSDKYLYDNNQKSTSTIFKSLSSLLIILTFGILGSAFMRLWLYENSYGLTELRFYSHVFIIFLGVAFLLFFYKTIFFLRESKFLLFIFSLSLVTVAFCNIINPEWYIAINNTNKQYSWSVRLDIWYVGWLSSDAVDTMLVNYKKTTTEDKTSIVRNLCCMYQKSKKYEWQELNYSRLHVIREIESLSPALQCPEDNYCGWFFDM